VFVAEVRKQIVGVAVIRHEEVSFCFLFLTFAGSPACRLDKCCYIVITLVIISLHFITFHTMVTLNNASDCRTNGLYQTVKSTDYGINGLMDIQIALGVRYSPLAG